MASEEKVFKLQQFQRTQQLIKDLSFEKASQLPLAAGAEGSSVSKPQPHSQSWIINRTKDSLNKNDMTLVHDHLKVMSEVDPANPYYSSLLERLNHGEHISWAEFEQAVNRFSSNEYYLVKLQDDINNLNLDLTSPEPDSIKPESPEQPNVQPAQNEAPPLETPSNPSEASLPSSPSQNEPHTESLRRPTLRIVKPTPNLEKPPSLREQLKTRLKRSQTPVQGPKGEPRPINALPSRRPGISSKTRKKAVLPKLAPRAGTAALLGGGSGAAASGGALGNLLGARSLLQTGQWVASRLGLNSLAGWLGKLMPERLLGSALRGLWNVGANFGRAAFDGLIRNAFNIAPRAISSFGGLGGGGIGSFFSGAAATTGAILTSAAFWWAVILSSLFIFTWWWAGEMDKSSNDGCASPGKVEIVKSVKGGNDVSIQLGQNIEYELVAVYNIRCVRATASLEIKDTLPPNTTFVSASSTVNRLPADPQPPDEALAAEKGTLQGNTVTWKINTLLPEREVVLSLIVTPTEAANNTWVTNQATVSYTESRPLTTTTSGENIPATQDNCNGTYKLGNPIGNYGDPSCNFTKDQLYTQLQQLDPSNANYWFDVVVKCESGYDPNAHADHAIVGTPDAEGAWGLFQMGRGKNGQYDHGDVVWNLQTSNAVNYNNSLASKWRYWACARSRW